mgnify:CR=1 FL=1
MVLSTGYNARLVQSLWLVLATLYVVIVWRTAWVGDDAFITLRTVDNFVHGYGLRWNVAERVLSYTHPLWMFVVLAVYAVTREPFYSLIALGMVVSFSTFFVILRIARSGDGTAPFFVLPLVFSRIGDKAAAGLRAKLDELAASAV